MSARSGASWLLRLTGFPTPSVIELLAGLRRRLSDRGTQRSGPRRKSTAVKIVLDRFRRGLYGEAEITRRNLLSLRSCPRRASNSNEWLRLISPSDCGAPESF